METTFRRGIGPEINELAHYGAGTGFSIVSTPAPTQGTYRIRATGTTQGSLALNSSQGGSPAFALTYRWLLFVFRFSGTLSVGQVWVGTRFVLGATGNWLGLVYVSGSTYNLRLFDNSAATRATGSTALTTGVDYPILIGTDGTNLTVRVYVSGAWVDEI